MSNNEYTDQRKNPNREMTRTDTTSNFSLNGIWIILFVIGLVALGVYLYNKYKN